MPNTPFEIRAGVRVFITSPRDDVPFPVGDDGGLYDRNFKATIVSQHGKNRWYAETDAGERLLVSKDDVVPLDESRSSDGTWLLAVAGLGLALLAIWVN